MKMKKFKLKVPKYSFDHEGMIIRVEQLESLNTMYVHAGDICEDNIDIMSKIDIVQCMVQGKDFIWRYKLDELEPLETIKMTNLDYEMLKFVQKQGAKYICRDENGTLNLYDMPPRIGWDDGKVWLSTGNSECLCNFTGKLFQSIKWEDKKYYVIEDVLNNCEVVEDEKTKN